MGVILLYCHTLLCWWTIGTLIFWSCHSVIWPCNFLFLLLICKNAKALYGHCTEGCKCQKISNNLSLIEALRISYIFLTVSFKCKRNESSKKEFNPLDALAPDLSLSWTLPVIGTSSMFSPSAFYAHFVLSQLFSLKILFW